MQLNGSLSHSQYADLTARTAQFFGKTLTIVEIEARKLRHDPIDLLARAIQPTIWLLVFGEVFTRARVIPTGDLPYRDFMAPGILAQSVLFISIFYGISIIWERDLGIIQKILATPTPRAALVLGKALAAGLRSLSQALIIYVLALVLGVQVSWHPAALLGVGLFVVLAAALFATLSLIIACLIKSRERFMGIVQVLTMPLFFASNAIYPVSVMPDWLKVVSHVNPLTYEVDGIRALMLVGVPSEFGLMVDFAILLGIVVALVLVGARVYPRVAT
ncbi:MAG: ABC transporter permease [Chloroflexi bacterium]|nr:ABC transporter permease [Chloroflexota bacterium]